MEKDRLRIPSTKRVCFVGQTRIHSEEEWTRVLEKMHAFIDKRISSYTVNNLPNRKYLVNETVTASADRGKLWGAGFVARPKLQRTRNCTQLKPGVKEDILSAVVDVVLAADNDKVRTKSHHFRKSDTELERACHIGEKKSTFQAILLQLNIYS